VKKIVQKDQLAENLWALEQALVSANSLFQDEDDGGRAGAVAALNAIAKYLNSIDRFRQAILIQPIVAVASALIDLDDGSIHPMMKAEKTKGRRPSSTVRSAMRAHSAGTMHLLMNCGFKRQEAAIAIASYLIKLGVETGGHHHILTWRTVAGWRDKLNKASADTLEKEIYRNFVSTSMPQLKSSLDGKSMPAIKRELLKRFGAVLATLKAND
jgi:hypothetical protein